MVLQQNDGQLKVVYHMEEGTELYEDITQFSRISLRKRESPLEP